MSASSILMVALCTVPEDSYAFGRLRAFALRSVHVHDMCLHVDAYFAEHLMSKHQFSAYFPLQAERGR